MVPVQPNLLLISLDTVRWDHTSLAGYGRDTTPSLAELSALPGATSFERAYAPAAWSLPAYASLLTGRDALSHGVGFLRGALDPGHATLAEALGAHGYATAAFTSGPHLVPETALGRGFATHEHITAASPMTPAVNGALAWLDERDAGDPFFLMVVGYDAHTPYAAPSAFAELYDPGYRGFLHQADNPLRDDPCALRGDTRTCLRFFPERFTDPSDDGADPDAPRLLVEPNLDWVKLPGGSRVELRRQRDLQAAVRALLDAHISGGPASVAPAALERLRGTELGPLLVDGPRLDPYTVLVPASLSQGGFDDADTAHLVAHYDAAVRAADLQLGRLLREVEQRGLLDSTIVVVLADHGEALGEETRFHHDDQVGDGVFHVPLVIHQPGLATTARWQDPVSLVGLTPTLLELLDVQLPAGTGAHGFTAALEPSADSPASEPVSAAAGASLCCYWVRDADWELQGRRVEGAEPGTPLVWSLYRDGTGPDLAAEQPDRVEAMRRHIAHWPDHPGRFTRFGLGEKGSDDPALRQALRDGGYWAPEPPEGSP